MTTGNIKLKLSGHETFHCRQFWLKKGYDFLNSRHSYADKEAVVELGVGKNMVASIRFWLEAFGITQDYEVTPWGEKLLADEGFDPFLEDIGTAWLLHYHLVKNIEYASIYGMIFNYLRKERMVFTGSHIKEFLGKQAVGQPKPNEATLKKDINVFFKNYLKPKAGTKNSIEDDFSVLLADLQLIRELPKDSVTNEVSYAITNDARPSLPYQIVLFVILEQYEGQETVDFYRLLTEANGPGAVFALQADDLFQKIQQIVESYPVVYKDDAGIRTLQFNQPIDKWAVLEEYYG